MRIIAGEFRSRRLAAPPGLTTRPTPDRLRESLFSILAPRLTGARFVDAYAGSGAVGLEALSRGAAEVVFLESGRPALAVLETNVRSLQAGPRVSIVRGKVTATLTTVLPASLVFLDPPYEMEREYGRCLEILAAQPPNLAILQHASGAALPDSVASLRRTRIVRQGDNSLSFYQAAPAAE